MRAAHSGPLDPYELAWSSLGSRNARAARDGEAVRPRLRLVPAPALTDDQKRVRLQLSLAPIAELLATHNVSSEQSTDVAAEILRALYKRGRP
jgi:hypothetical protein